MWGVRLINSFGKKYGAKVGEEGELSVVVHPHPPRDEALSALPYSEFFTQDADGTTSSMVVNGATTNISFKVQAVADYDIYVKTISVLIADSGAALSEFGAIVGGLTNGMAFNWNSLDVGTLTLESAIKTNFDFYRLASGEPEVAIFANISGNNEGVIPVIDLAKTFGVPFGLRLKKGSLDNLEFLVKDNLTTISTFNIKAYGIKI